MSRSRLQVSILAVLMFWANISTAACGWGDNELPFVFDMGAASYARDASGNYTISAASITYAASIATWQAGCASTGQLSSGAYVGAGKMARLSLWAFPSPFSGSGNGYKLAETGKLWLHVWDPNPTLSPSNVGAVAVIGLGKGYSSPTLQAIEALPAGTWYLTVFVDSDTTGNYTTYRNIPQPLVIGSAAPPPPPPTTSTVSPQVGLWWNPNESGSGYALDYKHGVLVVTVYSYKPNGDPQWYLAAGAVSGNVFKATLDKYTFGQCISCGYSGNASLSGNDGQITITFGSATSATVQLPGGRITNIIPQAF